MRGGNIRALLFAPECWPPAGAEAIVTCKFLLAAQHEGWKFDVFCQADAGLYYPSEPDPIWAPIRTFIHEIAPPGIIAGHFERLAGFCWAATAAARARKLHQKQPYDVVFSRIMPKYGHLPALMLSRSMGIPWIANWSDPMPREKAPPPYGAGPGAKVSLPMSRYHEAVARQADWHTFPSERLRKYVCSYLPECEAKSSVVPHIAWRHFESPAGEAEKVFTVCHTGGLGRRNPETFLEGVRLFLDKNRGRETIRVRFIGSGEEYLPVMVDRLGLAGVVSIEAPMSYEKALAAVAESSVAVVIEAPMAEGIFFPSKVADFVQVGRPILAVSPKTGVLSDLLAEAGGGIAADCTSAESVALALEILFKSWSAGTLEQDFHSGRIGSLFSPERALEVCLDIISQVSRRPKAKGKP